MDEADGGAQVVSGRVGMAASCVSVGLAGANHAGMETRFPIRVLTEPAREAWLCSIVDLLRENQWLSGGVAAPCEAQRHQLGWLSLPCGAKPKAM